MIKGHQKNDPSYQILFPRQSRHTLLIFLWLPISLLSSQPQRHFRFLPPPSLPPSHWRSLKDNGDTSRAHGGSSQQQHLSCATDITWDRNALRAGKETFSVMDAANRDAYIRQWVEQVKESNYTEKVLDRGQNFCPSPQTLDSSFASIASAPPLYQHSSQDHPRHFIPSGAHQKLVRSISSQPLSEHKPTTVSRVKNQSPVPSEVPPHHDLPSWDLAVAPNASPRKPLKPTNQSGGGIAKGIKDTPSTTEGTSSTINGTPSTTEGTSSTIKGTPSTISSTTHDGSSAGPCGFPESILYRKKPQLIAHPFTADTRAASPHTPLSICHAGLKDLRTPNYKEGGTPAKDEHKGHVRQYCVSSHQHQYGCSSESFNTNIRFLSKRSISAQFMVPEPKQLSPSFKPSPICGVNSTHCYTPNGAHPS